MLSTDFGTIGVDILFSEMEFPEGVRKQCNTDFLRDDLNFLTGYVRITGKSL